MKYKSVTRAREAGGSGCAFARFAGSKFFRDFSWGLRPRLYAAVRFADFALKPMNRF